MTTLPAFNPNDYPDKPAAVAALAMLRSEYLNEQEQLVYRWHNEQLARIRQLFDKPLAKTEKAQE